MTQVPASSHGGGSFPPAHWTVDAGGELAIAPPTTGGLGEPITELISAELTSDTLDVFRITNTHEPVALFNVDSGGTVEHVLGEVNSNGYSLQEAHAGNFELFRVAGLVGRAGKFIASIGGAADGQLQIGKGGCLVHGLNAAPADADLSAGSFGLWLDSTNGVGNTKLMVKAKSADGTVKTAAIVLA